MKIQELAIIFVIIILPISMLLSAFTQSQIQTINMQSLYDSKLTAATYDAIKAFQLNATNNAYSDIANSEARDIEASIGAFRNSLMSAFEMSGYSKDAIDTYIPALVYTLYDGIYIYSPYKNTHDEFGERLTSNLEETYGLKPYISYSCRYKTASIDVVITYTLDNYITVRGIISGEYVNRCGYLVDDIETPGDKVIYRNVEIEEEHLKENLAGNLYSYIKINGTKYYLKGDSIIYIANGKPTVQSKLGDSYFESWRKCIQENESARKYYEKAKVFTDWFKNDSGLVNLTYGDAIDEVIKEDGSTSLIKIWQDDNRKIFTDNTHNIEDELSNFNQHRLAIIRHKIETNLAIAIANYNEYSGSAENVFEMPELKETEWDQIVNNVCLISFLQGLPIGGKMYNGYTLVTNSQSDKVVLEENIYILGSDNAYHRIGDKEIESSGATNINEGVYGNGTHSAGRTSSDFNRQMILNYNGTKPYYYYPLRDYNASYNSIVMQNDVTTYDDIYIYVDNQSLEYKEAFYTALGREKEGKFNKNNELTLNEYIMASTPEILPPEIPDERYTVTYNARGGSVSPSLVTGLSAGDSVVLPTPSRAGYNFVGWSLSGGLYNAGTRYTVNGDAEFIAVWEIPTTYTIIFDANGGSVSPNTISGLSAGANITMPEPSRVGYIFKGWKNKANGAIYNEGTYTVNGNAEFIAIWEEVVVTYTVNYNANGGTVIPNTISGLTAGTNITLPEPEREGYIFKGWKREVDGVVYNAGTTYTVTSDTTFKANWEVEQVPILPAKTYTITYNVNGGDAGTGPANQVVEEGKTVTIPSTIPTRNGVFMMKYIFKGWSTSNSRNASVEYMPGDTITVNNDITLYAVWQTSFGW